MQHMHSAIVTFLSFCGTVAALWWGAVDPRWATDIAIFLLFFLPIGFGVTVGLHRHFTHRSFKAATPVRVALAVLGSMAAQGPVVFWVALHRHHHEFADQPGDPHSPNLHGTKALDRVRGLLHAYVGWTVKHDVPNANFYARDILRDPVISWVNRHYYSWVILGFLLPAAVGFLIEPTLAGAVRGMLWGGAVRMLAGHNIIWLITSFAHTHGRQDYQAKDLSRNNAWLAIPTLGEGWHNNHHAFPTSAILSTRWWQIDLSGMVIATLARLRLAWDVNRISEPRSAARRASGSAPQRRD